MFLSLPLTILDGLQVANDQENERSRTTSRVKYMQVGTEDGTFGG
jgi:hypothetical protein